MAYKESSFLEELAKLPFDLVKAEALKGFNVAYFPDKIGKNERANLEEAEELAGVYLVASASSPKKLLNTIINPLSYINPWQKGGVLNQLLNSGLDWSDISSYYKRNSVYGPMFATAAYGNVMHQGLTRDEVVEPQFVYENGARRFTKYGVHEEEVKDYAGKSINVYLASTYDIDTSIAKLRDSGLLISSTDYGGLEFDDVTEQERLETAKDFYYHNLEQQVQSISRQYQDTSDQLAAAHQDLEHLENLQTRADPNFDAAAHHQTKQQIENLERQLDAILQEQQRRYSSYQSFVGINEVAAKTSPNLDEGIATLVEQKEQEFIIANQKFSSYDRSSPIYKKESERVIYSSSTDPLDQAVLADELNNEGTKKFFDEHGYINVNDYTRVSRAANNAYTAYSQAEALHSSINYATYQRVADQGTLQVVSDTARDLSDENVRLYQAAYRKKQKLVETELVQAEERLAEWRWRQAQINLELAKREKTEAENTLNALSNPGDPANRQYRQDFAAKTREGQRLTQLFDREKTYFETFWQQRGQATLDWSNFEETVSTPDLDAVRQRAALVSGEVKMQADLFSRNEQAASRLRNHLPSDQDFQDITSISNDLRQQILAFKEQKIKAAIGKGWQGYFDVADTQEDREKISYSNQYNYMQGLHVLYDGLDKSKEDFLDIQKDLMAFSVGFDTLGHAKQREEELRTHISQRESQYRTERAAIAAEDQLVASLSPQLSQLKNSHDVENCRAQFLEREQLLFDREAVAAKAATGDSAVIAQLSKIDTSLKVTQENLDKISYQTRTAVFSSLPQYDLKNSSDISRLKQDREQAAIKAKEFNDQLNPIQTQLTEARDKIKAFESSPAGARAKEIHKELQGLEEKQAAALLVLVSCGEMSQEEAERRVGILAAGKVSGIRTLSEREILDLDYSNLVFAAIEGQDPNRRDTLLKKLEESRGDLIADLQNANSSGKAQWLGANFHTQRLLDVKYTTRDIIQRLDYFLDTGDVGAFVKKMGKDYFATRIRLLKFSYDENTPAVMRGALKLILSGKDFNSMGSSGAITLKSLATSRTKELKNILVTKVYSTRWVVGLLTFTNMSKSGWEEALARKLLSKGGLFSKLVAKGEYRFVNLQDYLDFWGNLGGRVQKKVFGTVSNKFLSGASARATRKAFNEVVENLSKKVLGEAAKRFGKKAGTWLATQAARWGIETSTGVGAPAAIIDMAATVTWEVITYLGKKSVDVAKSLFIYGEVKGPIGILIASGFGCFFMPIITVLVIVAIAGASLKDFSGFTGGSPLGFSQISDGGAAGSCPLPRVGICSGDCSIPGTPLTWPVPSSREITSCFGCRILKGVSEYHSGIDVGASSGSLVVAAASGIAGWCREDGIEYRCSANSYFSGPSGGVSNYGNLVTIRSGNIVYIYGHLLSVLVTDGASISAGSTIGKTGNTGRSTGPHLHFEVRKNGTYVNPCSGVNCGGFCSGS